MRATFDHTIGQEFGRARSRRQALLGATAVVLGLQAPTALPVLAQGATIGLEEIIVTARKREEDLFQAPLSITSLTAEEIDRSHIRDIAELTKYTPGFFYTAQATFSSARVTPSFRFRGMNNGSNDPLLQQGGMFIDGVYLFGGAQSLTFDDVARVEVIKGPQSALFGRGTFGGAINFITKQPADHFVARASGAVETRGSYDVTGSVEGPIVADRLSARLSGARVEKGAHFHTTDGGDLAQETTSVFNGQVVWKPTDDLQIRVRRSDSWQDDSHSAVVNMNASRPDIGTNPAKCLTGTQPYWCGVLPLLGDAGVPFSVASVATSLVPPAYVTSNNPNIIKDILNNNRSNPLVRNGMPLIGSVPHLDHAGLAGKFARTTVEAQYDFANGMSASATFSDSALRTMSAASTSDDGGNGWVLSPNILEDRSVDVRLSSNQKQRLTWTVGGNYYLQTARGGAQGTGSIVSVSDITRTVSYSETATFSNQGRNQYYAGFFSLHYDVLDQLAADFEGRVQSDRVTTSYQLVTQTSSKFTDFLPRAILTYKPNTATTIYASWAKGVLPGTTNSNTTLLSAALQTQIRAIPGYAVDVPTETVQNFELGVKQKFARWRYAVTGYHMKWDNLKNIVNLPCPSNVCGPTVFAAFAPTTIPQAAKISGVESEVEVLLTDRWDVKATFDYVHARYTRFYAPLAAAATGRTDASGKTIYGFPATQGTLSTTYRGDFGGTWNWYTRGDLNYTGRIYLDEINQAWIGGFVKANLRAGVENTTTRFEIYVDNLLDDKHWLSGIRSTQSNYHLAAAPVSQATATVVLPRLRTFGARVTVHFD